MRYRPILTVALLLAPLAARATDSLPGTDAKVQTATKVFDDLVSAIGDGRSPPAFRIVPRGAAGGMQVAWFDPTARSVSIQEETFDLCASLGIHENDALAVLLGHELAHYYKDHGWGGDFGTSFAGLSAARKIHESEGSEDAFLRMETQADYFGGFYGYMAGYDTLGTAPLVLETVYTAYKLDAHLNGYPALGERKKIANQAARQLEDMVPVYDAAVQLMAVGRPAIASRLFDSIAATFPSREVLTNAAAARTLQALDLFRADDQPWAYPIESDSTSRLSRKRSGVPPLEDPKVLRVRLLGEAKALLEQARHRDGTYLPAAIDEAVVQELLGKHKIAEALADDAVEAARKAGQKPAERDALTIRGIANASQGRKKEAASDFAAALALGGAQAAANVRHLHGDPTIVPGARGFAVASEEIDGVRINQLSVMEDAAVVSTLEAADVSRPRLVLTSKATAAWRGLLVHAGSASVLMLTTAPAYSGATGKGLKIGATASDVIAKYGAPARTTAQLQGSSYSYDTPGITFHIGSDGKLKGWTLVAADD